MEMAKKNVTNRRIGALERFENQLKTGVKPVKVNGKTTGDTVALTEAEKTRLQGWITTLQGRIKQAIQ